MTATPFLTAADDARLNIRGSRDPLGFVPLWGHVGRSIVGNLTTATTSVRGFTSLMLGYYFAEEFTPGGRESDAFRLSAFLKFEQISAYARWHVNNDGELRGIREVRRRLEEQGPIRISADSAGQIMSNQKIYGLWGLYTMPARASGIIAHDALQLTPEAREFTESQPLRVLTKALPEAVAQIRQILRDGRGEIIPDGRDLGLLRALAKALRPSFEATERAFYQRHLVRGGANAPNWQPVFAALVERHLPSNEEFCLKHVLQLIEQARSIGENDLANHLESIRALEALLVPAARLFGYAQARDGATPKTVAEELGRAWRGGLSHVNPAAIAELATVITEVYGDATAGVRLQGLATALHNGSFDQALELCLAHNEFVMRSRNSSEPWVVISNGVLDVRYRDGSVAALVARNVIAETWQNSFYLTPVKWFVDQLRITP